MQGENNGIMRNMYCENLFGVMRQDRSGGECAPRRADAPNHSDFHRTGSPTSFAGRFFETTHSYPAAALLLPCDQSIHKNLRLVRLFQRGG